MSGQDVELFCGSRTEAGRTRLWPGHQLQTGHRSVCGKGAPVPEPVSAMDIAVLEAEEMPERFHAALNAHSRTYVYRVAIGDVPSVFERKYTYYCFGRQTFPP